MSLFTPTSLKDVYEMSGKPITILRYRDIKNIIDLKRFMERNKYCLIHYQTEGRVHKDIMGHWCALYYNLYGINYFDSYGKFPDETLNHIPQIYLKYSSQQYASLCELIIREIDKGTRIYYNDKRLQGKYTQTCGIWCAYMFRHSNKKMEEVVNNVIKISNDEQVKPDVYVVNYFKKL